MNELAPANCRVFSDVLRQGIVAYGFKPNEVLLLLILCGETFDRDLVRGRVDLPAWAQRLGMRADKLEKLVWNELVQLGVVDFNQGQGSFELRPDLGVWSRMRALRVPNTMRAGMELPLVAERPLDESLSSLSREDALARCTPHRPPSDAQELPPPPVGSQPIHNTTPRDWKAEWQRLAQAVQRGTVAEEFPECFAADLSAGPGSGPAAEKSPGAVVDKSAGAKSAAVAERNDARGVSADLSAAPIASLASLKGAKLARGATVEKSAAAWRWVEEVDRQKRLREERCARQWLKLCESDPAYVMGALKGSLEHAERKNGAGWVKDPLAFISRKARDERRFK